MRDVITIDGPAGAGKTTTARAVAAALGFVYLDSGALYRAIAVAAQRAGIGPEAAGWTALLGALRLEARPEGPIFRVFVEGAEVTGELRGPEVSSLASRLAALPEVRERVKPVLRGLAERHDCVSEGRDMGTVVFPDATLKIYLDAPLAERARRRHLEYAAGGLAQDLGTLTEEMAARDERDSGRAHSPLRRPPDAVRICNALLSPAEQAELIVALHRGGGWHPGSRYQRAVKWLVRHLLPLRMRLEILGMERIPRGPFILASNHRGYLDPPLLGGIAPGPLGFLAKRELFRIPLFREALRGLYAIPLRRGGYDKHALEEARRFLRQGIPVAIFPEGTRVRPGQRAHPRRGVALLARVAQVPVVPVHLTGTAAALRPGLGRVPVRVCFGEPLPPPDAEGAAEDEAYLARVMAAISALAPASAPARS